MTSSMEPDKSDSRNDMQLQHVAGSDGDACAFCRIIVGDVPPPARYEQYLRHVVFEPLNPVTPGHLLVVPRRHVPDAGYDWGLTGLTFEVACAVANNTLRVHPEYNLIVNKGADAGQSVRHLHVHIVPRVAGDDLAMPWSNPPLDALQSIVDHAAQWGTSEDW